jgi:glycosyltransferase involved in cell wall biosynthesis
VVVPISDVDALTEGLRQVLARSWDHEQIAGYARSTVNELLRSTASRRQDRQAGCQGLGASDTEGLSMGSQRLRIIGDGPQRHQLEAIAADNPRVVLLGPQSRDRIAEELAGADAFALASHAETFGVACAEALAAGLPVLTTAWITGGNGLQLVPLRSISDDSQLNLGKTLNSLS